MPAFFLCYRRRDAPDLVGRLHDRIANRFGAQSVFRDVDSIGAGADFRVRLREALDNCDTLIVVIGQRFLEELNQDVSDYVVEEIAGALERSIAIVPVLVHGAAMPAPEQLPKRIREFAFRQAAELRGDPDFADDVERLLRALSPGGANHATAPKPGTTEVTGNSGAGHPIRGRVHQAHFTQTGRQCWFINVTNVSATDVEVTHVWIETTPPTFPQNPDRPLPKRLAPQESWETWVPLSQLPRSLSSDQFHILARVRLSTGLVVVSEANDSVPGEGSVPGGPINKVP